MINLLLGAPGSGKSYEAVVFHIVPALQAGRKVITNLPLDLDAFAAIDATWLPLIELRSESKRQGARAFAVADDYGDTWKHAVNGIGPLYVIDECHFALPVGATDRAVEEWYSIHRHQNADVLLITQSYGKISKAIRDLVQVVYRVRKNVALGSMGSYTRKVQDGVRGEVVNTTQRRYESKYFKLYRSHTQGVAARELNASDVRPIWRHPYVLLAVLFLALPLVLFATGVVRNPMLVVSSPSAASGVIARPVPARVVTDEGRPAKVSEKRVESRPEPLDGLGVHYVGSISWRGHTRYLLAVSRNGQVLRQVEAAELVKVGYRFEAVTDCFAWLRWEQGVVRPVICDAPAVAVPLPSVRDAGASIVPALKGGA